MDYFNVMVMCLALNVYHEARWEPYMGKVAVSYVVLNRGRAHNRDICDVVRRRKQFSWTINAFDKHGKLRAAYQPNFNDPYWAESMRAAQAALYAQVPDPTHGARWYFADYIKRPRWASVVNCNVQIGKHIFCVARKHT